MTITENMRFRIKVFRIKLLNWEYWHSAVIYLPIMPYMLLLWLKARSVFFYNAANPGIKNGGFLMESKWDMHNDAPTGFFPVTFGVSPSENFELFCKRLMGTLNFPVIAKPSTGCRGMGVALIHNKEELHQYYLKCPSHFIVQEKIDYEMEAGIFYVKMPGQTKGIITGIVEKHFIKVTGDGQSTVYQLLLKNTRYFLQIKSLEKIIPSTTMQMVLKNDEPKVLIDIGNHARGAYFVNANHKINQRLTEAIDNCCQKFPGFNYGRLDIRFKSWEQLEEGQDYAVIELNGSGSEPTHIYDPANSIFYAWKEICRHWKCLCDISIYNHSKGVSYLSFKEGVQMLREDKVYGKLMKQFEFTPNQSGL